MKRATVPIPAVAGLVLPYEAAHEHLSDLLVLHDWRLRREIVRGHAGKPTDALGFPVITDQEVMSLLAPSKPSHSSSHDASLAECEQALQRWTQHIAARVEQTRASALQLPILELARCFALSDFEMDVLVACVASEVDRRYERIYGYLHDDMTRKQPTAGLMLNLVAGEPQQRLTARTLLNALAPLRYYRLIEVGEDGSGLSWLSRPLRMDERIAGYLLGDTACDARIAGYLSVLRLAPDIVTASIARQPEFAGLIEQLMQGTQSGANRRRTLVYLHGPGNAELESVAYGIACALEAPLLTVDAETLCEPGVDFERVLFLLFREALLSRSLLYLQNIGRALDHANGHAHYRVLQRCAVQMGSAVLMSGEQPWSKPLPVEPLVLRPMVLQPVSFSEQVATWQRLCAGRIGTAQLQRLTSVYPLPLNGIDAAWRLACMFARTDNTDVPALEHLQRACRAQVPVPTCSLSRRIVPKHRWSDLVLPTLQLEQLQAICSQAKHTAAVYGAWCFERKLSLGKGLNAMFSGPPGTGKTMAAEVIAADLGVELLKIDLSQIVSKYIGETEKNLRQLFDQAAAAHAILFFDEADALLGKRSDVKDAHDRYANTETAYLLQKMEEYEGITILATNLRQNMDEAFTRRMRFIVDFAFPEDEERLRIWQTVWPKEVPMAADVDLPSLSRQFRLSGGSIRNVALSAAFLAAEQGTPLAMCHLMRATKRELQKMGRLVNDEEYRRYG